MSNKDHGALPLKSNPHPFSNTTTERQTNGGNSDGTVGEKHGSPKAQRVPAEKRFAGAEKTSLSNSPGRVDESL